MVKLYGMPAARGNGCVTYVKKAWLDNCGLDVPTNYDEYLAMLEAFTTGDPDGNGVNGDTVYLLLVSSEQRLHIQTTYQSSIRMQTQASIKQRRNMERWIHRGFYEERT